MVNDEFIVSGAESAINSILRQCAPAELRNSNRKLRINLSSGVEISSSPNSFIKFPSTSRLVGSEINSLWADQQLALMPTQKTALSHNKRRSSDKLLDVASIS